MYFLLQHVYEICWYIRLGGGEQWYPLFRGCGGDGGWGKSRSGGGGGERHGELIRCSTDCQQQNPDRDSAE